MAIWITSSYPDCAAEVKINQIVQPHVQLKSLALMHNQLPPNHKRHKELECPHKLKLPGHQFQGIITSKQLNDYGVHEELFFFSQSHTTYSSSTGYDQFKETRN